MKIVVGITGASGLIYAQRLLNFLKMGKHRVNVIVSENARKINELECRMDFGSFGFPVYKNDDFSAPFISGSALYDALVIVPCSMNTLGKIGYGISDNVITRTADVFLKEGRKAIFVVRETPLNLIHIKNMQSVASAGGIILPASPAFYTNPKSIDELVDTIIARILDNLGIENELVRRWGS